MLHINGPEWLTVAGSAEASHIFVPTVYRHVTKGTTNTACRGGCIRIPREELQAFREEDIGKMAS